MTNHHDELRVAPDPSQAEELRQRLHARLASGHRDEPVVPIHDVLESTPSVDADPDHREGDIIMLEIEDRPAGHEPMTPRRPSPGRWLLVAAAVAVVAVLGTLLVAVGGEDEDPVDTVRPPTTAPAQDVMELRFLSDLALGDYFIDPDGDDTTPLRVSYEIAADGWAQFYGAVKFADGGIAGVTITTVRNLVTDGCLDVTPLDPPVGPTVDDLATALTHLSPFEVTAPPTDVTLFGYSGKHLELTVPADFDQLADCVIENIHTYDAPNNGEPIYGYSPGETEEFWILDVDGTRLMITKRANPTTPAQDIVERDAVFDSIRIEP